MNSTINNSFEIAAVFSDLYNLIKADEIETEYKTDKNVISNKKDNNKKDNENVIGWLARGDGN